jgi:exodeoxyribonuclease VII small subunit
MKRLEEIVSLLEKGEATLDSMLTLYEEGSALMLRCNSLLEKAKRKVEAVNGDKISPFGGEDA